MSAPAKYRSREEVQKIREEKDPRESIKAKLLDKNIYTEEEISQIDEIIRKDISEKADKAINAKVPDLSNISKHVLI